MNLIGHAGDFNMKKDTCNDVCQDIAKEIYWEHDGRMDDPEYARKAIKKIETYEKNGIFPGQRLVLTFETLQDGLDMKIVEKLAREYLL